MSALAVAAQMSSAAEAPTLMNWFASEREVVQWGGPRVRFPLDDEQLRAIVDESQTEPATRLCWMARRDRELIGHAQLALDWRNGTASIGRVAIAPERRGQGLARPMVELVLAAAFALDDIERVELGVYSWNALAIATYKRLGFQVEGTRRASTRIGNECWDSTIMSLLRAEYRSV
jgi:RimJ/RimL family protein N-acetyltransferase